MFVTLLSFPALHRRTPWVLHVYKVKLLVLSGSSELSLTPSLESGEDVRKALDHRALEKLSLQFALSYLELYFKIKEFFRIPVTSVDGEARGLGMGMVCRESVILEMF